MCVCCCCCCCRRRRRRRLMAFQLIISQAAECTANISRTYSVPLPKSPNKFSAPAPRSPHALPLVSPSPIVDVAAAKPPATRSRSRSRSPDADTAADTAAAAADGGDALGSTGKAVDPIVEATSKQLRIYIGDLRDGYNQSTKDAIMKVMCDV
jgi:hypothetical protein